MGPKGKGKKEKEAAKPKPKPGDPPPKPKKIPPPPAIFTPDDLVVFKQLFKEFDEENIDKIPIELIPTMLRRIGLNPKPAEVKDIFARILEDDLVDQVEYHEWLQMIEAKIQFGDDIEINVVRAFQALGHDDEETGFVDFEVLREEFGQWGNPFTEVEFMDWTKLALKDKTLNPETLQFCYGKFIENMNAKDTRFFKEPINFFKLDQKTLAEMAIKKAAEEKEAEEKKEAERLARLEAKRQKMIADGLVPDF